MEKKLSFEFISSMFDDPREKKIVEYLLEGNSSKEIVCEIATQLCTGHTND